MLLLLIVAVVAVMVAAVWQLFAKAGRPGWAALVPFYNFYIVLRIVGRPGWWLALMLIPIVNIVYLVFVAIDLAKAFGKDGAFAFLLILLPFVGFPLLGFGATTYRGPVADPAFQHAYGGYPGHQAHLPQPAYAYPQQHYLQQHHPQQAYPQQYPQQQYAHPYPQQAYPQQHPRQQYPPQR